MSGIQNLFSGMRTSASGLSAERTRIDVIAENIANARTTRTPEGGPYRRKVVMFEPILQETLDGQESHVGVNVSQIVPDMSSAFERVLDPGHPDADPDGFVEYPNVNTVLEMADLITAMRAYEANVRAQEAFVEMAERALALAR